MPETRKSPSITGLWIGAALFGVIALFFMWLTMWISDYVTLTSLQNPADNHYGLLWSNYLWIAGFMVFALLALRNVSRIINLTGKPWWLYVRLNDLWNDDTPYQDDLPA